ncbi:MAG: metal-dependent hydrolase [Candidatus Latescibacterota bacterium]|jgi:membrane-bound metal-dependent hydrolase YbcI (DUF457 family)
MNFKGHLISGVIAGIAVAEGASRLSYIDSQDYSAWGTVCATTTFFSLFPDLDTSSVPQRWFFRFVFGFLLYLGWNERYELATIVAILSLLPLLDHHRGWTHWKVSPLVVSVLVGAVYEYWRARHAFVDGFSWDNVHTLLQGHTVFLVACVVGWYTHLLLDGRFKLFPTERGHH